ncbi:MAG: arginine repressor [Bacteroidota bacterium]
MISKNERQFAIREILDAGPIASQDELRRRLRHRGIDVTQATLSRDMKEIGVLWVNRSTGGKYELESEAARFPSASPGLQILSIVANEFLVVVHTLPGSASIVGEYLDHQKSRDVIGTVAGDNTLLVVPRSARKTRDVVTYLKSLLLKGTEV